MLAIGFLWQSIIIPLAFLYRLSYVFVICVNLDKPVFADPVTYNLSFFYFGICSVSKNISKGSIESNYLIKKL